MLEENPKFTFDDMLLVPEYSENDTREGSEATKTKLFGYDLDVPVISSPMDSITGTIMMRALRECGAIGVHHRYCELTDLYNAASLELGGVAISPSISVKNVLGIHKNYPKTFFVMDVAHGNTKRNLDYCEELIKNGIKNIVSGNIVTPDAVEAYLNIGVWHFRVGVGNGASCTTRLVTGFGFPQASAIYELHRQFGDVIRIISDGGLNSTGDAIKALALGANYLMTGKLLAGTDECPIKGIYRGMASAEALSQRKTKFFAEGESMEVKEKGAVNKVIEEIKKAIQTACFYGGVNHFSELIKIEKILITNNSKIEGDIRK
jgi:IMP dehydrogenase/GMP reductase